MWFLLFSDFLCGGHINQEFINRDITRHSSEAYQSRIMLFYYLLWIAVVLPVGSSMLLLFGRISLIVAFFVCLTASFVTYGLIILARNEGYEFQFLNTYKECFIYSMGALAVGAILNALIAL